MNDLFATIYEWLFYNQDYKVVFDELYNGGFTSLYVQMGLLTLFGPFVAAIIFYFAFKNPWLKWWHWLLWGIFSTFIVVGGITFGICYNGLYGLSQEVINEGFVKTLIWQLSLLNSLVSFVLYFIYGFLFKSKSKSQSHLPF